MTYAVTISGNNISFSMAAVEYSVSLSQSGLQGVKGDKGDKGDTGALQNNIVGAYLGAALAEQPLFKEASLYADLRNQVYAKGDRSGLTAVDTFDNLFDFSRSTIRAGFDAAGDLVTFAANAPRFVYGVGGVRKGLSVGPAITNNAPYSKDITNAIWSKAGGSVSGTRFTEDTSTGTHNVRTSALNFTSGVKYVAYADFGADRERDLRIVLPALAFTSAGNITLAPDHSTAIAGSQTGIDGGVIPLPDGTYRLWITAEASATSAGTYFVGSADGLTAYTGDGTSGFDLHRFQFAEGVYPGDFVETAASPLTHTPDLVEVKPAVVADIWNDEEWTVMLDFTLFPITGFQYLFVLEGVSQGTDRIQVACATNGTIAAAVVSSGVAQGSPLAPSGPLTFGSRTKYALSYKDGRLSSCRNGSAVTERTGLTLPPLGVGMSVFKAQNDTLVCTAEGKTLAIIPRALTDTELQAITS